MRRRLVILWLILALFTPVITEFGSAAALSTPKRVCDRAINGYARCHSIILTELGGETPLNSGTPRGYGPANFRAAYRTVPRAATHVAIVTAYDAPTLLNDLATFSKTFDLPILPYCTTSAQAACLEKLNQEGRPTLPPPSGSWSVETSLDTETVHGMCPSCRISVIEANSPSLPNLAAATITAARLGAKVVSHSYGGTENSGQRQYDANYKQPGVVMVVSSGDSGYGTNYPAAAPSVVAVGGTTLTMHGATLVSETAWSETGSGCSVYEPKPAWQHDIKCSTRSIADIAADANPQTGAAIYDSYSTAGRSGWLVVGGTSLAAPLVAGIIASSGNTQDQPATLYSHPGRLRDIVDGRNGSCLGYYCHAVSGYDGPTGLGVPNHW